MYAIKLHSFLPFSLLLWLSGWLFLASPKGEGSGAVAPVYRAGMIELGCVDTVNITLDKDCRFDLTPKIVLAGDFGTCVTPEDFRVIVYDKNPLNGSIIDGPGLFRYAVTLRNPVTCTTFSGCWGVVRAEDKTAPEITLPPDYTFEGFCANPDFFLNNRQSLNISGKALFRDNCAPAWDTLRKFTDAIFYDNLCDTLIIRRVFFATDVYGNTSSAAQLITLVRPPLAKIQIAPRFELDAGCDANHKLPVDEKGNLSPLVSGFPYVVTALGDTVRITPGGACGFSAEYRDERYAVCKEAYKIIRHWKIIDWCRKQQRELEQVIKIGDIVPPTLACPVILDTLRVSTTPFNCTATFEVPAPKVTDACSGYTWSAEIWNDTFSYRFISGKFVPVKESILVAVSPFGASSRIVSGVPPGCHRLVYKVRDDCENASSITCTICVQDKISPVAVCDDSILVSLDSRGFASLRAEDVDEGSRDNCALAKLELRRVVEYDSLTCQAVAKRYSDWGPSVTFSCCDAGKSVVIELRASDKAGNTNICWTAAKVEDKIGPICTAPLDTTIDCDKLPINFNPQDSAALVAIFGNPVIEDNCGGRFTELPPVVNLDNCGSGTIKRRFTAVDNFGNRSAGVCEQIITIRKRHNYTLKFPKDFEDYCKKPRPDSVKIDELGCDVLAVYVEEKRYQGDGKSCFRIYRNFEIINWCEYDGASRPVIVPRDADCNGKPGDKDVWVIVRPDGTVYFDNDPSERNDYPAAGTKGTACDGLTNPKGYWIDSKMDPAIRSTGYWRYTQEIEVFDNEPAKIFVDREIILCSDQIDCSAEVYLSVGVIESCSPDELEITTRIKEAISEYYNYSETDWERFGRFPKYIFTGILPVGEYLIEVKVVDACKNVSTADVRVKIVDCGEPSPICYNGLAAELMPLPPGTDADGDGDFDEGAVTLWATDFLQSALEACSPPLKYSINREGETPDPNQQSLVLTCDEKGKVGIEIHAWDNAFNPNAPQPDGSLGGPNHGFCSTYVIVQDNQFGLCDTASLVSIAGTIRGESGLSLPAATMALSGARQFNTQTDNAGAFQLANLRAGYDYTLTPSKPGDALLGVTTYDLILITQHILGVKSLGSPYQILAADVNRSRTVTTLDLIQLRKIILGIDANFAHGKSWQFIDAAFRFPEPLNPWKTPIPEILNYNDLAKTITNADFIAIKTGDVNGSAWTSVGGVKIRNSAAAPAEINIAEQTLSPGTLIQIPVRISAAQQWQGYQFALHVDPRLAEIMDIQSGLATKENLHWNPENGEYVKLSWDKWNAGADWTDPDPVLFTLVLKPNKTAVLSDLLRLDNRVMTAEAYPAQGQDPVVPISLHFSTGSNEPELLSVAPNPAGESATVRWWQPGPADVHLIVRDAWGRQCAQYRQNLPNGLHDWTIHRSDLPAPGLYVVTMEVDGLIRSKKVVFY